MLLNCYGNPYRLKQYKFKAFLLFLILVFFFIKTILVLGKNQIIQKNSQTLVVSQPALDIVSSLLIVSVLSSLASNFHKYCYYNYKYIP